MGTLEDRLRSLKRLELIWAQECEFGTVVDALSFGDLGHLTINSADYASTKFLSDTALLMSHTTQSLTTIDIFSMDLDSIMVSSGEFIQFFHPLLSRRGLRHVSVSLTKHCLALPASAIDTLARAWPALEVLNLSFHIDSDSYLELPDLQHTLPYLLQHCPQLSFLHLPVLETIPGEGQYELPEFPDSQLYHLSSDTFVLQSGAMDVAFGVQSSFPRLAKLGPPGGNESTWAEVWRLVLALRQRDFVFLFQYAAAYMLENGHAEPP